jgi:hypothetical protein
MSETQVDDGTTPRLHTKRHENLLESTVPPNYSRVRPNMYVRKVTEHHNMISDTHPMTVE